MRLFSILLTAAVFLWAAPADADCVDPVGEEGVMVYNITYKTMQFCNGSQWIGMAGGAMPALSGATMAQGWPDAIQCSVTQELGTSSATFYMDGLSGDVMYYSRLGTDYSSPETDHRLIFNSAGMLIGHAGGSNVGIFDCVTGALSIAQLYASGRAFNLNGGGGSGAGDSGGAGAGVLPGWPGAIVCTFSGWGRVIIPAVLMPFGGDGLYYYRLSNLGIIPPENLDISFSQDGSYNGQYSSGTAGTAADCAKPISQIIADGQAFY